MNELLSINWGNFISLAFVFVRIGIIFATVPFFNAEIVPRKITALIAFFLSLVLVPVVPPFRMPMNDLNLLSIAFILLHEMLVGLCMGLAIDVIFAGLQIAGEIIGFQMGFSMANVIDPMSGITAPIISNMLYITAFLLFFSFGGHHLLIRALVESFRITPIGDSFARRDFLMSVIVYGGQMFTIGVKVSAPIVGVLLLVNIAFAVIARALPQMNVFIMAFPLTIAVGLVFTALVIKLMPMMMSSSLDKAWTFIAASMKFF
jgi:flagellar biosynthetic protein FliR